MVLLAIAVGIGVLAGFWRRGDLGRVATVQVQWWPLLAIAGVALVLVELLDPHNPAPLVAMSILAITIVALSNAHLAGFAVVAVGLAANLLVLTANDGIPVDPDALVAVGLAERDELDRVTLTGARHLQRADDHLVALGDVIPVPVVDDVVSFGDLILLVGLADVIANLMTRRRRPRPLPANAEAALISIAPPIPPRRGLELDLRGVDLRDEADGREAPDPRPGALTR